MISSDIDGLSSMHGDAGSESGLMGFICSLIGYNHWYWLYNKIQCKRQNYNLKPLNKITIDQLDSDSNSDKE